MVYHTLAWLSWLGAAAYLALVNQQPLHAVILILAAGMVFTVAGRDSPLSQSWGTFLRLGLWMWVVALGFNILFSHAGNIVLLRLPANWPFIGGRITLEALLYGLANGASLFSMLLIFAAFNLAVDQHRLLRWIPTALFQAGLVVSIAVAFVPQMVRGLQDIREAQRIRGHRFRGLRDLLPLLIPLITTALERSLTLAESIEARGFGGVVTEHAPNRRRIVQWLPLAGLMALLIGLFPAVQAALPATRWAGTALIALGLALIGLSLYLQGQGVRRSQYRRELWRVGDSLVVLCSMASILLVSYVRVRAPLALSYYPYPPFSPWPRFNALLGSAALLISMPALLWPRRMPQPAATPEAKRECTV